MSNSISGWQKFLADNKEDPATIAKQIRKDQVACREGHAPSILVTLLPPFSNRQAQEISRFLLPKNNKDVSPPLGNHRQQHDSCESSREDANAPNELTTGCPETKREDIGSKDDRAGLWAIRRLQYEGIIDSIKKYLTRMDYKQREQEMSPLPTRMNKGGADELMHREIHSGIDNAKHTAADLSFCQKSDEPNDIQSEESRSVQSQSDTEVLCAPSSTDSSLEGRDVEVDDCVSTGIVVSSRAVQTNMSIHEALAATFKAEDLQAALKLLKTSAKDAKTANARSAVLSAASEESKDGPYSESNQARRSESWPQHKKLLEDGSHERPVSNQMITAASNIRHTARQSSARKKKCYICCFVLTHPHSLYPSLCNSCGAFNTAESELSLPSKLKLEGRIAVVTGGRVNLGFHTALRLLRCGAKVIITSRYPLDAERRYREQLDYDLWLGRLRIIGADFRTASDVFRLVEAIKKILSSWTGHDRVPGRVDILISNAAQTLTDSIAAEQKAIANEKRLITIDGCGGLVGDSSYEARVRGGATQPWGLVEAERTQVNKSEERTSSYITQKKESEVATIPSTGSDPDTESPSSWLQSLSNIPYEDFVTVYSVNSLVPMILLRELMPFMTKQSLTPAEGDPTSSTCSPTKRSAPTPSAYVINVSAREGIFEDTPTSSSKNGTHVHTNMAKAALNSITHTEAGTAWKRHKIAINTVDPGYMLAVPERKERGDCPLGFEDGVGRVLWPVAVGENEGEVVWGRFLKHFGKINVDVGLGQ